MQLFIDFNEDGTLNRCEVHQRTASGQVLVYRHLEAGTPDEFGKSTPVVAPVPFAVEDTIDWALDIGLAARDAQLDKSLSELGDVPPEKLAAVKAAIAAALSK